MHYVSKTQFAADLSVKFLKEWNILKNLKHPNIVDTESCFYGDKQWGVKEEGSKILTILMEYCDGECYFIFIGFNFFCLLGGDLDKVIKYNRYRPFPDPLILKVIS